MNYDLDNSRYSKKVFRVVSEREWGKGSNNMVLHILYIQIFAFH